VDALKLMCICELLIGPKDFITGSYLGDEVATLVFFKRKKARNLLALIRLQMAMPKSNTQKGCQPNWEHKEILALVKAKQDEHIINLDVDDRQDKFETIIRKWNKISMQVMIVECSNQLKNGVGCKDKWGSLT
jgi:hypothetical protein